MECCKIQLPDTPPCCSSTTHWVNKIQKVKIYPNGDCYDELNNYLGKGKLEGEILTIEK